MWLSVLTKVFLMTFLVTAFRCSQVHDPSPSPTVKTRKGTVRQSSWGLSANQYSRPIGRLSKGGADGALSLLATITFLGEQGTPPTLSVGACSRADGGTTMFCPTISKSGHAHQVIREAVI